MYKSYRYGEHLRLGARLLASNGAMMSAWFLLVPVPMVTWLAVFASHALASVEYAIQVPANAAAYERKLGLVAMRAPQEIIMFMAFVVICALAGQTIHLQQLAAFPLVVLTGLLIMKASIGKLQLTLALTAIGAMCVTALLLFRFPHIITMRQNHIMSWDRNGVLSLALLAAVFISVSSLLVTKVYAPALRQSWRFMAAHPRLFAMSLETILCGIAAGFIALLNVPVAAPWLLLLLIVGMCFVPNSFMIIAWYGHTQIQPSGWFSYHPTYFKYLVAWGTAFLEYSFLVPLLRFAYQYLSIFQVFGLMELSTISVFLCFAYFASKRSGEQRLTRHHFSLYAMLILIEVVFCAIG